MMRRYGISHEEIYEYVALLEEKISDDINTEEELELYIEYRNNGEEVFKNKKYFKVIIKLDREIAREWGNRNGCGTGRHI